MNHNKIIPSLWFSADNGSMSNIIAYYKEIFDTDFEFGYTMPLGETPSGNTEMSQISIFGQNYSMMSTANLHHSFNDAFALTINCEGQEEIDKYWNYFTQEGKAVQCGWCIDKYGLRWQVIPSNLGELMSKPNAWEVMMQQSKIVIEEYLK